MIDDEKEPNL